MRPIFCSACYCDRKCAIHELLRHKDLTKHAKDTSKLQKQQKQTSMLHKIRKIAAKAGEVKMPWAYIMSFNIASHMHKLICARCLDLKIAEQLSMSRTKARTIIVNVTGRQKRKVDESSDKYTIKHLAL